MKKGFTMIELIFVIVILGILASVAIPRLAGTKAVAEISAAVANLRTLVNDASAYYTAKGFATKTVGTANVITTKWNEITNVPLENAEKPVNHTYGYLLVDGERCIEVQIDNTISSLPAYIKFGKYPSNANKGVCKEVLEAAPIKAYFESEVMNGLSGTMALGSSTIVY